MKRFYFIFIFLILTSCNSDENYAESIDDSENIDLPEILKKGKLCVLAENSSTSYFIYRGKKMGFEFELLKEFANFLGVELEIKTIKDYGTIKEQLNDREADIVASNFIITKSAKRDFNFSIPIIRSSQVLIQREEEKNQLNENANFQKTLNDPLDLANKKVYVRKNSVQYNRIIFLQEEIGDSILIQEENSNVSSEELIEQVSDGKIDFTLADKNVAQVNKRFYENINIELELSIRQNIGFALRKNAPLLKAKLDEWLKDYMQKPAFRYTKHKYFELSNLTEKSQAQFSSLKGGQISAFDHLFKKEAAKYNWDWTFIAAVAYQESKFSPTVVGFGGSYGMMQFMPEVGPKFGVYPNSSPEVQIAGGMKKLIKDFECWPEIKDKTQRLKFALASYNAGLNHIKDAQRLAKKHNLDPTKWDENVEIMVKNLSNRAYYQDEVVQYGAMKGGHTQKYVRSVFSRYLSYKSAFK